MKQKVSVIVVTYNSDETVEETLRSIQQQKTDAEIELIVSDGGSTDSTLEIASRYANTVLEVPGGSIGQCRNEGASAASGDFIAFTDSDCAVPEYWVDSHIETLENSGRNIAGVGGPNIPFDDDPQFSKAVGAFQSSFLGSGGSPQSKEMQSEITVDSVPACNVMYKSEVFEENRYDSEVNVGEDAEFHYRLSNAGYQFIFDPQTAVHHHLSPTISDFFNKNFSYGEAMAKIQSKHQKVIRWYSFLPAGALVTAAGSLAFSNDRKGLLKRYVYTTIPLLIYSFVFVWKRESLSLSFYVLLLLPAQYISYGLGFISGIVAD